MTRVLESSKIQSFCLTSMLFIPFIWFGLNILKPIVPSISTQSISLNQIIQIPAPKPVEPAPKPIEKIEPIQKPKEIIKPKPTPKPIPAKPVPTKAKPAKTTPINSQPAPAQPAPAQQTQQIESFNISSATNHPVLAAIKSAINKNHIYPRAAKRLKQQGEVLVEFIWTKDMLEHFKCFDGVLIALYKVGGVEGEEKLAFESLSDLQAAVSHVAVDSLLILVKKGNAGALSILNKLLESVENFLLIGSVIAFGAMEAEHTDVLGVKSLGYFDGVLEDFEMGLKIVFDPDLTDRRTYSADGNAVFLQGLVKLSCLFGSISRDVLSVNIAQFNVLDTGLFQDLYLSFKFRTGFISKTRENEFRHKFILLHYF